MQHDNKIEKDIFAANGWLRLELFDPIAIKALEKTVRWATDTHWESVRTPHLFMGLLSTTDRRITDWCRMIESTIESLLLQFTTLFKRSPHTHPTLVRPHREFMSENTIRTLRHAHERMKEGGRTRIQVSDIMISLFTPTSSIVAGCFADFGYSPERLAELAVSAERLHPGPDRR